LSDVNWLQNMGDQAEKLRP